MNLNTTDNDVTCDDNNNLQEISQDHHQNISDNVQLEHAQQNISINNQAVAIADESDQNALNGNSVLRMQGEGLEVEELSHEGYDQMVED